VVKTGEIWVLPEISGGETSKTGLGLLTEARRIAAATGGDVTALVLGDKPEGYSDTLGRYGVTRALVFQDPLLKYPSAEAYAAAILTKIKAARPWLCLMGDTPLGRELAPHLAARLDTGAVTGGTRMDLTQPDNPRFYRYIYGGQLEQEITFEKKVMMLVTMHPDVLDATPLPRKKRVATEVVKPKLSAKSIKIKHIKYLPADYRSVDVAEADTIVAAGMGAATDELLPLVEELAALLEGAIGTTRPVIDAGKIGRERMIGQTGKVVSPAFYLALGISGASHHTGGIQESGRIVAVNRDPQAPIFAGADAGAAADLREVLPKLIERIKAAKENGEIV